MPSLSNTQQRAILRAAAPGFAGLYWYAEAQLPVRLRQDKLSDGYFPGAFPGRHIPVIAVGPCAEVSRAWVELLCGLFWSYQPSFRFEPMLTSRELLVKTGAAWYEWGEPVCLDAICYACGQVGKAVHTVAGDGWLCATCAAEWEVC
jgi:hypothetical protein